MAHRFLFVGVSTGGSSIIRIFPRWRDLLGLGDDLTIAGMDLPLHASRQSYRELVAAIKDDPEVAGGLITAHKIDLYQAASDLFDETDSLAQLCGEVSCFARREGLLHGWATDPISAGRSLDEMLGPGYFERSGGQVLCLGAGGAGVAILLHLLTRPEGAGRPPRIVVADSRAERLEALRRLCESLAAAGSVEYVATTGTGDTDALVAAAPPGSLVINATGMGKDTPGSPLGDGALFPERAVVWELNYRGDLDFLHQAWAQRRARALRVIDGWRYFIYGWTTVLEEVFQRPIGDDDMARLAEAAAFARPTLPTSGDPDLAPPPSDRHTQ